MAESPDSPRVLSFLEARILGVLIEKEKTTPDTYPLTLNSLTAGCNHKSARDPVISVAESEVQAALEDLRSRVLVLETYGASGRVLRYAQNFGRVYGLPAASVALLATLALRGEQTVSELRANSERLYRFDDSSSVEAYLEELAGRSSGALVIRLPREAGSREHRWAHLLCGAATLPAEKGSASRVGVEEQPGLEHRVARLDLEVAELRTALKVLLRQPGDLADELKLREISKLVENSTSPLRGWVQRRSQSRDSDPNARIHESTIMRWLERCYGLILQRFKTELADVHGLTEQEIDICKGLAADDMAGSDLYSDAAVK